LEKGRKREKKGGLLSPSKLPTIGEELLHLFLIMCGREEKKKKEKSLRRGKGERRDGTRARILSYPRTGGDFGRKDKGSRGDAYFPLSCVGHGKIPLKKRRD